MPQSKNDFIERIAEEMVTDLKQGYFKRERAQNVLKTAENDVSTLNRVLDNIQISNATKSELYNLAMKSKDPVNEVLVPIVQAVSNKVLDSETKELNVEIQSHFPEYQNLKNKHGEEVLKSPMLYALGSACGAIIADEQDRRLLQIREEEGISSSQEEKACQNLYDAKIGNPFDSYLKQLTVENFFSKHQAFWSLGSIYKGILSIVNYISSALEASIETKVARMHTLISKAHDKLTKYHADASEDEKAQMAPLLTKLENFKGRLKDIQNEIEDKKGAGVDYKAIAQEDLKNSSEAFSSFIHEQMNKMAPEGRNRSPSFSGKMRTIFVVPKTPIETLQWLTDSDSLLLSAAKKEELILTKLASTSDSTQPNTSNVAEKDIDPEDNHLKPGM